MIRVRIERYPEYNGIANPFDQTMVEGLTWYENGAPVGRVIIEKKSVIKTNIRREDFTNDPKVYYEWIPVEVIDDN